MDGFQQVGLPLAIGSRNDVDVRNKLQGLLGKVSKSGNRQAGENHWSRVSPLGVPNSGTILVKASSALQCIDSDTHPRLQVSFGLHSGHL